MELDPLKTCCFSGHRPDKLPSGYREEAAALMPLRRALAQAVDEAIGAGCTAFLCGMAQGADRLAAEDILRRIQRGAPLRLVAALPCPQQDARWPRPQREQDRRLLAQIPPEDRFVACDSYTPYCMNGRNLWMTEHASRLIAVFDGSTGGTANTVRYAEEHGLTVVRIHPQTGERW